jgi:hypothetical protein
VDEMKDLEAYGPVFGHQQTSVDLVGQVKIKPMPRQLGSATRFVRFISPNGRLLLPDRLG